MNEHGDINLFDCTVMISAQAYRNGRATISSSLLTQARVMELIQRDIRDDSLSEYHEKLKKELKETWNSFLLATRS